MCPVVPFAVAAVVLARIWINPFYFLLLHRAPVDPDSLPLLPLTISLCSRARGLPSIVGVSLNPCYYRPGSPATTIMVICLRLSRQNECRKWWAVGPSSIHCHKT